MEHDFLIYNFIQKLTMLINNSQLSMGELSLILESLYHTVNDIYQQNIQKVLAQQETSSDMTEDKTVSIPINFEVEERWANHKKEEETEEAGQEE